LEYKISAKLKI